MSKLFEIYHPYSSNWWYTMTEFILNIQMYPEEPTEHHIYDVIIQNDIIYTHRVNKINKFIKNSTQYIIYSNDYSKYKPLLTATIYEDELFIKLTEIYCITFTGNEMDICLKKLQTSYDEYKKYLH